MRRAIFMQHSTLRLCKPSLNGWIEDTNPTCGKPSAALATPTLSMAARRGVNGGLDEGLDTARVVAGEGGWPVRLLEG